MSFPGLVPGTGFHRTFGGVPGPLKIGVKWSVGARHVSPLGAREASTSVSRKMEALPCFPASAPERPWETKERDPRVKGRKQIFVCIQPTQGTLGQNEPQVLVYRAFYIHLCHRRHAPPSKVIYILIDNTTLCLSYFPIASPSWTLILWHHNYSSCYCGLMVSYYSNEEVTQTSRLSCYMKMVTILCGGTQYKNSKNHWYELESYKIKTL